MAWGWSPAGLKGASTRKLEGMGASILGRTGVRGELENRRRYIGMEDKLKGKAEELKGKATGDKSEEWKGKAREGMGDAKDKMRDAGSDMRDEADRQRGAAEREREEMREPGPDR